MAPRWALRLVVLLVVVAGAWALAGASPLCSSRPPGAEWVEGLARRASVVLEGQVVAHSVAQQPAAAAAAGGGEEEEATSPPPAEQPTAAGSAFSGSSLSPPARAPRPRPRPPSPAPAPSSSPASSPPPPRVARVRVHQVWPRKSGGLRKDALLRVLLTAEPGAVCGSSLREASRYIFFLEPAGMSNASGGGGEGGSPSPWPLPPLFRASSPPLEAARQLQQEVGRALCTAGGCGE